MQVLIPAGGRGVRLRPLTNSTPKPLLPLGDRPILTRIIDDLPAGLAVNVLVSKELRKDFAAWQSALSTTHDVNVYVEEPRIAGPPGPVVALSECVKVNDIDDDLLVVMGDSVHPFAMEEFLASGSADELRIAAYRLPDIAQGSLFGVVEMTDDNAVTFFAEKPKVPRSPWVFTGCAYIPRREIALLHLIADLGVTQMGDFVARCLAIGRNVRAFRATGEWHDIGNREGYFAAHRGLLPAEARERLFAKGNTLEGIVYVHPEADVAGSRLRNCIISGPTMVRDSTLVDCVIHSSVPIINHHVDGKFIFESSIK